MFIVDSHCHLDILNYNTIHRDIDDVIDKALMRNVKFILTVSTSLTGFTKMKSLVGNRKNIAMSCGIHPLNKEIKNYDVKKLYDFAKDNYVVALGETGLDYFYQEKTKFQQQSLFREHIRIAIKLNKPIIVHMRNSCHDTLSILQEHEVEKCGGVLHCFTDNKETAEKILDLGLYISFSGIITFPNAEHIRNVVRYVPLDRILLETDSPYLSPVPYRGKENQPAFARDIGDYIAQLKGVHIETLAEITTENFSKLFHISF